MVDLDQARRYTARDADELGMVFTFEHMNLDQQPGLSKFLLAPLHCPPSRPIWRSGSTDWPRTVGTRCIGTTTTNRGWSAGSATTPRSTG